MNAAAAGFAWPRLVQVEGIGKGAGEVGHHVLGVGPAVTITSCKLSAAFAALVPRITQAEAMPSAANYLCMFIDDSL